MEIVDKTKAIEYLVHDIFITEHNKRFAIFLAEYNETIRKSTMLSLQLNMLVILKPVIFDLREPTEQLVKNIVQFEILYKNKQ